MRFREPIATIVEIRVTMVFDELDIAPTEKPVLVRSTSDALMERLPAVEVPGRFDDSDFYMGQ
jgi:hypothetical protein